MHINVLVEKHARRNEVPPIKAPLGGEGFAGVRLGIRDSNRTTVPGIFAERSKWVRSEWHLIRDKILRGNDLS
jgi:hypothetical protein